MGNRLGGVVAGPRAAVALRGGEGAAVGKVCASLPGCGLPPEGASSRAFEGRPGEGAALGTGESATVCPGAPGNGGVLPKTPPRPAGRQWKGGS